MTKMFLPCRVWAANTDQAIAEINKLLTARGLVAVDGPQPYPCPVQPRLGQIWFEAYVKVVPT